MKSTQIDQTWLALRVTYGLVAFLAGLDKFTNLLTNWEAYVAPAVAGLVPMETSAMMQAAGVVEMAVGVLILTRWTRLGAYVVSAWLLLIAFNLVLTGSYFDVAVRDVAMAVGAWTLARLSELRQPVHTAVASPMDARAEA